MKCRPVVFSVAVAIMAGLLRAGPATRPTSRAATTRPRPSAKAQAEARGVFERLLKPVVLTAPARRRIEGLIADLGSDRWTVREAATKALSKLGAEGIGLVEKAAGSKDPEVATRAAAAMKTIQDRLEDVGSRVSAAVDVLLAAEDDQLIPMLIRLLRHDGPSARYAAEYGLRRLTGKYLGYSADAGASERAKAAKKWQDWWAANAGTFSLAKAAKASQASGLLMTHTNGREVMAMGFDGKVAWKHRLQNTAYALAGIANGNILVGFSNGAVEEYDARHKKVWSNQGFANRGSGAVFGLQRLPNGNTLIAYSNQQRVSEVTRAGKEVWTWRGSMPMSVERLPNGNTLITEYTGNRVVEVARSGKTVWQYGGVMNPCAATKLANGNVLICESGAQRRVQEVNRAGKVVWQRAGRGRSTGAVRLPDGNTVIINNTEGAIVVGRDGKTVRKLCNARGSWNRICLIPKVVLQRDKGAEAPKAPPKPVVQPRDRTQIQIRH